MVCCCSHVSTWRRGKALAWWVGPGGQGLMGGAGQGQMSQGRNRLWVIKLSKELRVAQTQWLGSRDCQPWVWDEPNKIGKHAELLLSK